MCQICLHPCLFRSFRRVRQTLPSSCQWSTCLERRTLRSCSLQISSGSGNTHTHIDAHKPSRSRVWLSSVPPPCRDFYITMVKWISNTHLAVRWLNRPQNASLLTVCDSTVGVCLQVSVFRFKSESWQKLLRLNSHHDVEISALWGSHHLLQDCLFSVCPCLFFTTGRLLGSCRNSVK